MTAGIGVDVGGTKVLACVIDENGRLLAQGRVDSPQSRAGLLDALGAVIATALGELSPSDHQLAGIGIGLPGLVDREGVLHETPNMQSAEGLEVRVDLEAVLRRHVDGRWLKGGMPKLAVDNDATCAAAGELVFGAGRTYADAVVMTLGTGIGGGLISHGAIVHGARGFAGEIGHMVVEVDGPPCACGGRGCWEQFASGTGLARLAREQIAMGRMRRTLELALGNVDDVRGEHVFEAASEGDSDALEVVEVFSTYLAVGINNLAEILDPSHVILSGGLSRSAHLFYDATRTNFATFRRGSGLRAVKIVIAELDEYSGAFGAAALALGLVA